MRRSLPLAFLIVVCSATVPNFVAAASCIVPLTYSVGAIDSRFGVSNETVVQHLRLVESTWETGAGRELFAYAPTGGAIRVELVYDYRQAETEKLLKIYALVDVVRTAINTLFARMDDVGTGLTREQEAIGAEYLVHASNQTAQNAQATALNQRGATTLEFQEMSAKQAALDARLADLRARDANLNNRITLLATQRATAAKLSTTLETMVEGFRVAHEASSQEFEAGHMQQTDTDRVVRMFQFTDQAALLRNLGHEFGHALGLDHVSDSLAIMYRRYNEQPFVATIADVTELERVCPQY